MTVEGEAEDLELEEPTVGTLQAGLEEAEASEGSQGGEQSQKAEGTAAPPLPSLPLFLDEGEEEGATALRIKTEPEYVLEK